MILNYDKLIEDMWINYPCIVAYDKYALKVRVIPLLDWTTFALNTIKKYVILSLFSDSLYTQMDHDDYLLYWTIIKHLYIKYIDDTIKLQLPRTKVKIAK